MSKMDNLRAMREAKYARSQERGAAQSGAPQSGAARPAARPAVAPAATGKAAIETAADTAGDRCGHRNMGGRTCTRERGHAAKSHRYS